MSRRSFDVSRPLWTQYAPAGSERRSTAIKRLSKLRKVPMRGRSCEGDPNLVVKRSSRLNTDMGSNFVVNARLSYAVEISASIKRSDI